MLWRAAGPEQYERAMQHVKEVAEQFDPSAAPYLIPLAYRKRTLFKMDLAEAVYMAEIPHHAGGTLFLSPHRLADVPGGAAAPSGAESLFPGA